MRTLFLAVALLTATTASAQTISSDTTWSGTVNLDRDVVVNAGVTLTISAGTTVNVATTDAANLGTTAGKIELIVNGTLNVNGNAGSPVLFTTPGTTAGSWVGIRSAGSTTITSATLEEATAGLDVTGGTASLTGGIVRTNTYGVRTSGGTVNVTSALVSSNTEGVYFLGGTVAVDHCTLVGNSEGVMSAGSTGSVNVTNSVITNNTYGLYRSGSITISNSYDLVWGNSTGNYASTSAGTGNLTTNPLYVGSGGTPYRLTSNSPARKSDSTAGDMGAFAYVSDATSSLTGTLWSAVTLSGAQTVTGDLVIPAGVTVTVPAGATLTAATSDLMQANNDTTRVEIIVRGTLNVTDSTFTTLGASAGAWVGVRVESGGQLTSSGLTVNKALAGVDVTGGNANATGGAFSSNTYGARTSGGTLSVSNALISSNTEGVYFLGGTVTVDHCTLVGNSEGVMSAGSTGSVNVTNSVITNNTYGLYRSGSITIANSYDLVWGNSTGNYASTSAGTGNQTANPLYVGTGGTPYRLTANSPARRSDNVGGDLGAFPYTSDATSSLTGTLWTSQTLATGNLTGDLVIPAGVTVTIPAGVTLTAATSDLMQANNDTTRVELIVRGTLNITGTTSMNAVLTTLGASAGSWVGVRVETGGQLTASGLTVNKALAGVDVTGGGLTVTGSTLTSNTYGVRTSGGTTSLGTSLISSNTEGVYFLGGTVTVDHCTLVGNSEGVMSAGSTGSVNVTNSVITNNTYGLYRSGSITIANSYDDVWGNSTGNYASTSAGTGNISSNPLYVGTGVTPYRLTANSPARKSDSTAGDMGAFPYVSDPTSVLAGTLWSNLTLSTSQTMTGDLIIPAGVTVTVPAGVTLTAATSDQMQANNDTTRVELIVRGTLNVTDSTFTTLGASAGAWVGVRVEAGGQLTTSGLTVNKALAGVDVVGGAATVNGSTLTSNTYGVRTSGGTTSLGTSLISSNTEGVYFLGGTVTVDHCTLVGNSEGVMSAGSTGSVNVTNSVVTNNTYGLYRSGSITIANSYDDVWGNSTGNYASTSAGTGNISSNPLYVGTGVTPYRLTANSPARKSDSVGGDMGAFPYVSDPTSGLTGTLWTSQTISTSQDITGDLIIPAGVTVTVAPGVTLTARTSDLMQANNDTTRVELIVRGTLSISAAGNPVTLTTLGASAGSWVGVRVDAGGSAAISGLVVNKALAGVDSLGTTNLTDCAMTSNTYGVRTSSGNATIARCLINSNTEGVYFLGGTVTVDHCTLVGNSEGVMSAGSTGSVNVTNSVVTNNTYGLYRSGSITIANSYDDVWGNSTGNYASTSAGTGNVSSNPLYVGTGATPYRLTSNSPARKSDSVGGDMGAFPYVSDPTVGLTGVLWADTTLSTTTITGDLTVAPGVTVTIPAGVTLNAATSDLMQANNDTTRVELLVRGTLVIAGNAASPVTLSTLGASAGAWVGINVLAGGVANISSLVANKANVCLDLSGTTTLSGSRFTNCNTAIRSNAGTQTLSFSVLENNSTGFNLLGGVATLDHFTAYGNSTSVLSSGSTGSVNVTNSLFSSNTWSLYRSGSITIANSNNLFFNSPLSSTTQGANSLTSDPLLVSPSTGDYHLQSTSPARGAGTSSSDLGAFPFAPGAVDHLVISPASTTVATGATVTFTATAFDIANNPVPSATITWSATAAAGLINSSSGVLIASCVPGMANAGVTATSNGKSASANLTLTVGPVASLVVTPSNVTVKSQAGQQFSATAVDSCGNTVGSPAITWSALGSVGTISSTGAYTAGCSRGSYPNSIVATAGSVTGRASVTVDPGSLNAVSLSPLSATLAAGGMRQFSASPVDGCGNTLTTLVTFNTSASVGTVSSTGLLTAGTTPGTFTGGLTASATEGMVTRTASADITVTGGAVASVMVMPTTATLTTGGTANFSAVALDSFGNMVAGTPTWSVVAGGGSINASSGVFTAGTMAGTFTNTVKATISGVSAFASVIVNPGPVTRVAISPASVTLAPMGTTTFTATGYDTNNNVVTAPVTWAATSASGSITQGGVFTAGTSSGSYPASVTATISGISGTANVVINAGALAQLVVTPSVASTQAGGTIAFTATGRDGNNNPVTVTPVWSVVAGGGTISGTGVFTAGTMTGTFSNTVRAESAGVTSFATVSVTAGALVRITLMPASADLLEGGVQQFTGAGADAFGNAVPVTLTWSADPMAGTISPTGVFTAGSMQGSYPMGVTAHSGAVSATAPVTVRAVVMNDAGVMDAGMTELDAGMTEMDAGMTTPDAGSMMSDDAGVMTPDAGTPGDTHAASTCGCMQSDALLGALGLMVLALRSRRRRA